VFQVPASVTAAQRARWLAELSEALGEAQQLLWDLRPNMRDMEALDLAARVEAARAQVQSLSIARSKDTLPELPPEWIGLNLWNAGSETA